MLASIEPALDQCLVLSGGGGCLETKNSVFSVISIHTGAFVRVVYMYDAIKYYKVILL